jgi:hypothetical protein
MRSWRLYLLGCWMLAYMAVQVLQWMLRVCSYLACAWSYYPKVVVLFCPLMACTQVSITYGSVSVSGLLASSAHDSSYRLAHHLGSVVRSVGSECHHMRLYHTSCTMAAVLCVCVQAGHAPGTTQRGLATVCTPALSAPLPCSPF